MGSNLTRFILPACRSGGCEKKYWLVICVLFWLLQADAQVAGGSRWKERFFLIDSCAIQLDVHTLVPGSLTLLSQQDTLREFSLFNKTVSFPAHVCAQYRGRKLYARYRVFNFDVAKHFSAPGSDSIRKMDDQVPLSFEYRPGPGQESVVDLQGLDYRGSFSRGFSIGNQQSLVLNSNFDMQLNGSLGNGMQIVAAISDDNLPVQAEGNTQQLQEFDKIFIQVSRGSSRITAGDFELKSPAGYFMRYYKKLEGLSVAVQQEGDKQPAVFAQGSVAVSRGKFARSILATTEGNQGPYRLSGNQNERFIIILSGTEKVFFNGILLQRGYDLDYVIDYNRAELTFSPTRAVARDSRVIVEFEYTDISYLRTLYATETTLQGKKWALGLNIYSEQDSRQGTGAVLLDSTDYLILENSGDNLTNAVRKSYRMLTAEEQKNRTGILYAAVPDPLKPGEFILYFSENQDSAIYQAIFTEVGAGKGDYNIDGENTKNGRVYKYAGKGKGTYLPQQQLIPPEQRQMANAHIRAQPVKGMDVRAEVAISQYDINRISDQGNQDNLGAASTISIRQELTLDSARQSKWYGELRREAVSAHFNPLNPFRPAEFIRDWNIGLLQTKASEQWWQMSTGMQRGEAFRAEYGIQYFERQSLFSGVKQEGLFLLTAPRWQINALGKVLSSTSRFLDQKSLFLRPNVRATYFFTADKLVQLTLEWDAESNQIRGFSLDTLSRRSVVFNHIKGYFGTNFDKNTAIRAGYSIRKDALAKNDGLSAAALAYEWELGAKWLYGGSDLQWSLISRELRVLDAGLLPNDKSRRTILGRFDHTLTAFKQAMRAVTSWNTTSGQEPRYEYVYQKVENGQGEYVYIGDTTQSFKVNIQDFRYDPTNPLASYIRLSLPNNIFVRTTNTDLNQSLSLDFSRIFTSPTKPASWQNLASRCSALSNIRMSTRYSEGSPLRIRSLFEIRAEDTSLVSHQFQSSQTFFFNKGHEKFDLQIGRKENNAKLLLISGTEQRDQTEAFCRVRWALFPFSDLIFQADRGERRVLFQVQPQRNLDILYFRLRPELNIRPTNRIRLVTRITYQEKRQRILSLDKAKLLEATLEVAYREASQTSADASVSVANVLFTGEANSFIEYDLLEGLKNGVNVLWQCTLTKRLTRNMDFTLRYEGRKTGYFAPVHVAKVQVKATF